MCRIFPCFFQRPEKADFVSPFFQSQKTHLYEVPEGETGDLLADSMSTGGRLVEVVDYGALSLRELLPLPAVVIQLDGVQVHVGDGPVPVPGTESGAEEFVDNVQKIPGQALTVLHKLQQL